MRPLCSSWQTRTAWRRSRMRSRCRTVQGRTAARSALRLERSTSRGSRHRNPCSPEPRSRSRWAAESREGRQERFGPPLHGRLCCIEEGKWKGEGVPYNDMRKAVAVHTGSRALSAHVHQRASERRPQLRARSETMFPRAEKNQRGATTTAKISRRKMQSFLLRLPRSSAICAAWIALHSPYGRSILLPPP